MHYYRFEYPAFSAAVQYSGESVLGLAKVFVYAPYDQDRVIYRRTPNEVEFYHYHRWVAPPAELIWQQLYIDINTSSLFERIVRYPHFEEEVDFILRISVVRLEEWDEENEWYAVLEMNAVLEKAATGEKVFEKRIAANQVITDTSPQGVVVALNTSMQKCSEQLLSAVKAALKP